MYTLCINKTSFTTKASFKSALIPVQTSFHPTVPNWFQLVHTPHLAQWDTETDNNQIILYNFLSISHTTNIVIAQDRKQKRQNASTADTKKMTAVEPFLAFVATQSKES